MNDKVTKTLKQIQEKAENTRENYSLNHDLSNEQNRIDLFESIFQLGKLVETLKKEANKLTE